MTPRRLYRGLLALLLCCAAYAGVRMQAGTAPVWLAACGAAAALLLAPAAPIVWLRWRDPHSSAMMRLTQRRLSRGGGQTGLAFSWVDISHVSREMWLATIAAEDGYFREHAGFDWESIREAHLHNRSHERKRGGSTISQQVAKNLFLWPARSWVRKALEAWLTVVIEACWPKRRILEIYLNVAQFGPDVFGVEAAARRFFGKRAADLTRTDAALLAAALPSPARHRVDAPSHQMRFRQTWVLGAMRRLGDLYLEGI